MNLIILLVVFGAVAYRVVPADDRQRYFALAVIYARQLKVTATLPRPELEAFLAALRDRTPRIIVVPAIIAVNVLVALAVIVGPGSIADPATMLRWGANLGTRTTNGEWWRLLTAVFVHAGVLQLAFETIVLLQLGAMVERLVGRASIAGVYLSAGVFAGLLHVAAHPVDVGTSAAGALFGLYGLMAACIVWQLLPQFPRGAAPEPLEETAEPAVEPEPPASIAIPSIAMKRIAVVGVLFLLISAVTGAASAANLSGLLVGAAYGAVLGWRASVRMPAPRTVGATCAACTMAAVVYALPLRNIADVKPDVDRVIAVESRTAAKYGEALERFSKQKMSADALAALAVDAIVPELQDADARLKALQHVPPEHQRVVEEAREFLRLRCASWQARADALRRTHKNLRAAPVAGDAVARMQAEGRFRSTQAAAGKAEAAERTASEALERVKQNYSWRPIAE